MVSVVVVVVALCNCYAYMVVVVVVEGGFVGISVKARQPAVPHTA